MFERWRIIEQANSKQKDFDPDNLKYARSHMELEAYRQRWIQIALTATNVIVACLTCLKVFGII